MENKIFNKTCLIIFLILVLVGVILVWLFLPKMMTMHMNMQGNRSEMTHENKMEIKSENRPENEMNEHFDNEGLPPEEKTDKNLPYVNPKTGTLMDGPGFERGEIEGVTQETMAAIPSNMYFLDDGNSGNYSIQHNLCSKSCCSAQWPTPFKQKYDPYVCGSGNKNQFIPSQIMCSNSFQNAGCLCLTKPQAQFLYMRGGNGRELF
jgi:hypothetical protein